MELVFEKIMLSSSRSNDIGPEDYDLFKACLESSMSLPDNVSILRPSYLNFKNVVQWGGTVENGLAAALCTLNADHGPFTACFDLISKYFDKDLDFIERCGIIIIKNGENIAGFGNPILKMRDDRTLKIRERIGNTKYEKISDTLEKVLQDKGKIGVYSNLAFWCAATAHKLGLPRHYASCIPIIGFQLTYLSKVQQFQ